MSDIRKYLDELYPSKATELENKITQIIKHTNKIESTFNNPNWYKNVNLYVAYPGLIKYGRKSAFDSLVAHLPRIKELGCFAIHVLPFFESPMVDKGFDVSDFKKIRPELGNLNDVKRFKKTAQEEGVRVFMDLVFNHVSEEHEWFKKAEAGEEKYRNYFIHARHKPTFLRTFHRDAAVWAEYEIDGQKKPINVAFPEQTDQIPHWREGKDGYWYYHTYYPQQLDVNWQNPDVFLEFIQVLVYWASLGFNFRLDAIPFIGKSAYKEVDKGHEKTFAIIAALKSVANEINKECVIIVETYESLDTVIEYFGNSNRVQAELSYNFHLCTSLWVSIIKNDISLLWPKLNQMMEIPNRSEWLNFLRNHDELSLAYLDDKLKDSVSEKILERGASFREGFGISGRTYSLLGNNERRYLMAYFLLMSLGGGVAMPYGDEIGKRNIPKSKLSDQELADTRNINRGVLRAQDYKTPKAERIFGKLQELFERRNHIFDQYINICPVEIKLNDKEIFAAKYVSGASELIVIINLSHRKKRFTFDFKDYEKLATVNDAHFTESTVKLNSFGGIWLQK